MLVTGATSGLGLEAATTLARMGASVRLLGRSADKAEAARAAIVAETGNDDVAVYLADLGDLDATRRVAAEILEREPRLDVLVHNAGALLTEYRETPQGHEVTFATMVLAPHLLTRELRPLLGAGLARDLGDLGRDVHAEARGRHARARARRLPGSVAYAKAKRAQVVLTEEWAKRLRDDGVAVHVMHPGWADTPGIHDSLPTFSKLIGPLLRDRARGRRHDRVARGRRRARPHDRQALARPTPALDRQAPEHAHLARGARPPVGARGGPDHRLNPDGGPPPRGGPFGLAAARAR